VPLYLTVSEGPRADRTRPVLAVSDQRIITELLRSIGQLGDRRADERADPPAPEPVLSIAGRASRKPVPAR
jgi:hypothetical protein